MDHAALVALSRPVSIDDRALFADYFSRFPQSICEMTFTNMLLWGKSRSHLVAEVEGHVVTSFQKRGEERIWYPPIGPDPARIIREVLTPTDGFHYLYVDEKTAMELQSILPVKEEPDRFDYIYDLLALRSLYGAPYLKKRNFINRCKTHSPEVVRLDATMAAEAEDLMERWRASRERPGENSILDEVSSFRLALKHFDELELIGVALRINGRMEAFALGAPVSTTMFVEHFEKASEEVPGLYPTVLHELTKVIPEHFTELNKEEDLGIPGQKMAKEGWHPSRMVKKYSI
jgi:hypothetical protein